MSTTLTNGLKLPDKGSVDWYADMQNNYTILDGAVGTIAEHTSALSGKAPLVHTHTKADITDFPAYGTTAGTICEGNDSRLSDARTPVAHTHLTADVTDFPDMALYPYKLAYTDNGGNFPYINLADSNHIALGFNGITDTGIYKVRATADVPGTPNTLTLDGILIVFNSDGTANVSSHRRCQQIFYQNSTTPKIFKRIGVFNITSQTWNWDTYKWVEYANTGRDFIPNETNSLNIGSSSNQWNNLYAKNYYYNGVAWGLDKANTWSAWQTQEHTTEPLIRLRRSNLQIGDPIPASQQIIGTIPFADKNNLNLGLIACRDNTNGDTYLTFTARQRYDSNGRANNGTQYESRIDLGTDSSHNLYLRPNSNADINLGTSTNKWKTLNGVNPGALSLPDMGTTADVNYFDFISTITHLDGTDNYYTPTVNGWMTVIIAGTALSLFEDATSATNHNQGSGISAAPVKGYCLATIPVHKSKRVKIQATGTSVYMAQVRPCLGNV